MTAAPSPLHEQHAWRRWIFFGAVAVQLVLALASILTLSSVRAIVGGESLWTKGLSTSMSHLARYAETGAEQELAHFRQQIAIPMGVGQARELLDAGDNNLDAVREGLLQGENHPDDIQQLLLVLPWIWQWSYLQDTLSLWREGDGYVQQLSALADRIEQRRSQSGSIAAPQLRQWRVEINDIHRTVMPLAKRFTAQLGEHSRQLSSLLLLINLCTAALLCTLHWFTVRQALRESRMAHDALEAERLHSTTTLQALSDGVITLDASQCVRYANPVAEQLLQADAQRMIGQPIEQWMPFAPAAIAAGTPPGQQKSNDHERVHWLHLEEGKEVAIRLLTAPLDLAGAYQGTVLVLQDVSQEQNYMRMLDWQQKHDLLTGLDNRPQFEKHLKKILGKQQASLLHLNLDHFKMINASYGHDAGDEILRQVCQQLRLALRESDLLARIGGDEFAVLLTYCQPHAAMQTAERLRKALHELNVQWHHHNLHTGVSIGVVHIDMAPSQDPQALLSMAASACKHAKESGRNRITVYNPHDRVFQRHQGDMERLQHLRNSLEEDRFTLFAQTVYPLHSQQPHAKGVHFEVLLRLNDLPGKQLPPSEFIPIAERYDLMPQIDRWVVRNALRLIKMHLLRGADISTCAINLSGSSLGDTDLLEFIRHNLLEQGIAPEKLCFEITETSAIASLDRATSMIDELRKLGCRFALDDFGSGMASFKYLQQLPVDYLKIDGSFVRDMLTKPSNLAMVEAINHIGHVMGKTTVAEYVGDHATFEALRAMGVDYAQGYYVAPPVPLNEAYFVQASSPPPQIKPDRHRQAISVPRSPF